MEGSDSNTIYLTLKIKRKSGPFWISLFIPTICLILAAELTIFVDEQHFQAVIMVALTSNLVMYTLYSAIQEKLPEDSSIKLIDIWQLHGLLMPMVVFVLLVIKEILRQNRVKRKAMVKSTKVSSDYKLKIGAKKITIG